MDIASSAKRNK